MDLGEKSIKLECKECGRPLDRAEALHTNGYCWTHKPKDPDMDKPKYAGIRSGRGYRWTLKGLRDLRGLLIHGYSTREIATNHGRTPHAVEDAIHRYLVKDGSRWLINKAKLPKSLKREFNFKHPGEVKPADIPKAEPTAWPDLQEEGTTAEPVLTEGRHIVLHPGPPGFKHPKKSPVEAVADAGKQIASAFFGDSNPPKNPETGESPTALEILAARIKTLHHQKVEIDTELISLRRVRDAIRQGRFID